MLPKLAEKKLRLASPGFDSFLTLLDTKMRSRASPMRTHCAGRRPSPSIGKAFCPPAEAELGELNPGCLRFRRFMAHFAAFHKGGKTVEASAISPVAEIFKR